MIDRRRVLQAALAMVPASVIAAPRVPRIYMILFRGETGVEKGFRDYLREHGMAVELIVRDVAQDVSKVAALVREARTLRPDLIYTWGTPVTLAVAGRHDAIDPALHILDIPIVFTMVASPEGAGLVRTRTSSQRNLTGTSHVVPTAQQLSAMRAYRHFERLGVVYNPAEPNSQQVVRELRRELQRAAGRCTLVEYPVPLDQQGKPQAAALPGLVASLAADKVQMLYMGPDTFLAANRASFTEAALAHRLPVFSATELALRDGKALFGLVSGYENVGRLTAHKAIQILRRKSAPAAIPIEALARFSYLVNMSVAAQLQFYPPLKVINYAELIR